MNRRRLLVGLAGLGAIGIGGFAYRQHSSTTRIESEDDDITIHTPEEIPEAFLQPEAETPPHSGDEEGDGDETEDDTDDGDDTDDEGETDDERDDEEHDEDETDDEDEPGDDDETDDGREDELPPTLPMPGSGTDEDDDDPHSLEIDFRERDLTRFNSNSVSFVHDVFFVCNQGEECVTVWIDADPVRNEHGNPSVEFYRDGDLDDRLEDPDEVECLEPNDCLGVGIIARTAGLGADTVLADTIYVRSTR